jgi:hypothetical protein
MIQHRLLKAWSVATLSADGSAHAIQLSTGASEIKATLSDNRELTATVVGMDSKSDLTVLKIDAKDLLVMIFGDSSKVRVGICRGCRQSVWSRTDRNYGYCPRLAAADWALRIMLACNT